MVSRIVVLALAALSWSWAAFPQSPPELPAGAEALAARLLTRVGPQTQAWIRAEAARARAGDRVSELEATQAVRANRSLGNLTDGDVAVLAFLVLMEAQKSAQEDIRSMLTQTRRINDANASVRQTPASAPAAPVLRSPALTTAMRSASPSTGSGARQERAQGDINAANELDEMESLRLQTAMDRRSKAMTALSNLMKKMTDTAQSITQNLK